MQFSDVPIRGTYFRGSDIVGLVDTLPVGTKLDLEREPENTYDAYAIKALYDGIHIGYVGAEYASWIAPHLDDGSTFSCEVTRLDEGKKGHVELICSITQNA